MEEIARLWLNDKRTDGTGYTLFVIQTYDGSRDTLSLIGLTQTEHMYRCRLTATLRDVIFGAFAFLVPRHRLWRNNETQKAFHVIVYEK